jgi:hypothetical protein
MSKTSEEPAAEIPKRKPVLSDEEAGRFMGLQSQGIDPVTLDRRPSSAESAEQNERKSNHEFRVFLVFGIPVGLVLALVIAFSMNLGNTGFFCAWAVCTIVSGAFLSSLLSGKKASN